MRPCYRASQMGLSNFATPNCKMGLSRISLQQSNAHVNAVATLMLQ